MRKTHGTGGSKSGRRPAEARLPERKIGLYWGNIEGDIGIMEKKMETLGPFKGIYGVI